LNTSLAVALGSARFNVLSSPLGHARHPAGVLSPDVVQAILQGRVDAAMSRQGLMQLLPPPDSWDEQRARTRSLLKSE